VAYQEVVAVVTNWPLVHSVSGVVQEILLELDARAFDGVPLEILELDEQSMVFLQ
jgi:hypothetical protein